MSAAAEKLFVEPQATAAREKDPVACALSQRALKLIEQHNIPPHPDAYALCYAYVEASDAGLVSAMDQLLARNAPISAYEIREICKSHLASDVPIVTQQKIGEAVARELSSVLSLLKEGVQGNDGFKAALNELGSAVPAAQAPQPFNILVQQLMDENQRMLERSKALQQGLEDSRSQIERLNVELEDVRNQSMRDPLTAVANRRAFNARLKTEIERAQQSGTPMCLVMTDIDHFKRVNDTFGHPVGDDVLKVFATMIARNIKGQDFVARYGGEEFAIILPKTPADAACKLIDNIRQQFAQKRLMLRQSRQAIGEVTASFGIAQLSEGITVEALIEQADEQLYVAKRNGRNRVCAHDVA